MIIAQFNKGKSLNAGAIIETEYGGKISYIAVGLGFSRKFKTTKGAERYLIKLGYERV